MAKISDNDAIYGVLDQLRAEEKYNQVLEKIAEVPEDEVSNKLWFRKIQALNDLGRFKETRSEIRLLSRQCSEPKDDAQLYYYLGYTFEHSGSVLKAVECYRRTKDFDPEFDNIQGRIDACMDSVNKEIARTGAIFTKMFADVDDAVVGAKGRKKVEYPEVLTYASLIESSFSSSTLGVEFPLDDPFFKIEDAETKEKIAYYLEKKYGVTDIKSLQHWYGNNRIAPIVQGVRNAVSMNIPMPIEKMSANEVTHFESIMLSLKAVEGFLPVEGVAAWDYNAVITLARLAYAIGIISNSEFCEATLFFTEECRRCFSSWKEYAHSVIIGGYFNTLFETQYDVKSATFFGTVAGKICMENYSKVKWFK